MSVQFMRKWRVTIARPIKGSFATAAPNGIVIEGLRVRFSIEKSLGKDPNKGVVEISNMIARPELQEKGTKLILEVGYGTELAGIFIGDVTRTQRIDEGGGNWTTRIELGDGERAYRHARVNKSFAPGTPATQVIKVLGGAMGLDVGNVEKAMAGKTRQYVNGFAARGNVAAELSRALSGVGLLWSVQDGRLQVLPSDGWTADTVPEISPQTGLVGSPEMGAPEEKGKPPLLHARCLVNPRIRPGARVLVRSASHNGVFRVVKMKHEGDTHATEWYTSFEGNAL